MHDPRLPLLVLVLLAALLVVVQSLRLRRQRDVARVHRAATEREEARAAAASARRTRASDGEDAAFDLLERAGYAVLARQTPGSWTVRANGEALTFGLRADYLVTSGGRRYIAEVKTGRIAPRLSHGPTRRQLLEYGAAFDVHGVILVDADSETLTHVDLDVTARNAFGRGGEGSQGATWRTLTLVSVLSFSLGLLASTAILR